MDAIVLAGGPVSPADPLYPFAQGRPKAFLPLAGRPMLAWVLDGLAASRWIKRAWVVGVTEAAGWQLLRPEGGQFFTNSKLKSPRNC